jgi:RNA polymerase I-specific transcription initiation factor RRN3
MIVEEFARLAHHLNLLYVYPRIEQNRGLQLSQFMVGSYATGGALRDTGYDSQDEKWTHLDAWFPYDPYQLPVSRRWLELQDNYVSWQPMPMLERQEEAGGDDDDDDEDEDEDEDDEDFEDDTATDDERSY